MIRCSSILWRNSTRLLSLPKANYSKPNFMIGKYKVIRLLGKGPQGQTYHVSSPLSEFDLALKLITLNTQDKDAVMSQLAQQQKLDHNNLRKIKDYFSVQENDLQIGVVSQLCIQNLEDRIRDTTLREHRRYMLETAEAINYLHKSKGVTHGNLHPRNILFDVQNTTKVADTTIPIITNKSLRQMSPASVYWAPQFRNSQRHTSASDVWALGMIYYQMLTRCWPEDLRELANDRDFPSPAMMNKISDKALRELVGDMLRVRDTRRPTIDQIIKALKPQQPVPLLKQKIQPFIHKFPSGDEFQGQVKNGNPHGKGIFRCKEHGFVCQGQYNQGIIVSGTFIKIKYADGAEYQGFQKNGLYQGKGILRPPNGQTYEGEWKNGMCNGKGKARFQNGDTVEGTFKDGRAHGYGRYTYAVGGWYQGQMKEGKCHGKGKGVTADGTEFEGWFQENVPTGYSEIKQSNGAIYKGNLLNGKKHGQGVYTFSDGTVYVGEFKDDLFDGKGVYTWPQGNKYTGYFSKGYRHGLGIQEYPSGAFYKGQYKNGDKHGYGTLTYGPDSVYEGEWKNDMANGKGKLTVDGEVYDGQWQDGHFMQ